MNHSLLRGGCRRRSPDTSRASRPRGTVPRAGRLVGGVAAAAKASPLLRHVWPTFARVATAWRASQDCRDVGPGRTAGLGARSREARHGSAGRAWNERVVRCYLLIR